ncbi:hypothetical protein DL98DRAFT_590687 [Cadophora sp. DSE1049]|nr:hypothetical protein DL98DRAFT_590687 [Cadophora sp. DSE1049]
MNRFLNYFNTPPRGYPADYGTTGNDPRRYHHSAGVRGLYGHQMQQNFPFPGGSSWTGSSSRLTSIPRSSPRSSVTNGFFNVSDSTLTSKRLDSTDHPIMGLRRGSNQHGGLSNLESHESKFMTASGFAELVNCKSDSLQALRDTMGDFEFDEGLIFDNTWRGCCNLFINGGDETEAHFSPSSPLNISPMVNC